MIKNNPNCQLCRLSGTANTVCSLGVGEPSEVMVLDEAPSYQEDETGRQQFSKPMERLRTMMKKVGLKPDKMFWAHAVACRPPDKKQPTKGEIAKCTFWVKRQMAYVKPQVVLLVGNAALQSITGSPGIQKRQGKPFEQDGRIYLPIMNPSVIVHEPMMEHTIQKHLELLKQIVDRGEIPRESKVRSIVVKTEGDFQRMLRSLTGYCSFDIETSCLYPWQTFNEKNVKDPARITMIGFGTGDGEYSIPWDHPLSPFSTEALQDMVTRIDKRLEDEDVQLVTHAGKFDGLWMLVHHGVKWYKRIVFDTMIAHYSLDENTRHGLKDLAQKFLGAPDWDIDKDEKRGQTTLEKLGLYHAHDLYYTRKLRFVFNPMLRKEPDVKAVFDHILMPCVRMFTEIEFDGVYINTEHFNDAESLLRKNYNQAKKELDKFGKINWGSSQQVAKLLFKTLKIPGIEKTAGGAWSTSESVIKRLDHPCAGALLRFREAKQQLSFFIEGWKPFFHVVERNGKRLVFLHPSFKLHGTVTGRLSCEHPNLQQVPREPLIRSLISAPPGWTLCEWDLSQIELRIAAELAQESNMLDAFIKGIDVHWLTVVREVERGKGLKDLVIDTARTWKQIKGKLSYSDAIEILLEMGPDAAIEINPEWKEYRKKAKAINFGYLYGMWWKKFKLYARDNYGVTVSDEQAQESREAFFELYPDFTDWHKKQRKFARKHGYVFSLSGRKRRLPQALLKENTPKRQEAERQAINSPVQSFANELNLMSALQLRSEYGRDKVCICGTVHDSVLAMVRNDMVPEVFERMLIIMKRPAIMKLLNIKVGVPIEADGKIGPWSKGVSLAKWKKEKVHV